MMELDLHALIEQNHEPVLVVRDKKIYAVNSTFRKRFRGMDCGKNASPFLPAYILSEPAEKFVSTALIDGLNYSVSVLRSGEDAVMTLTCLALDRADGGFLSETLMTAMLSSVFNIGLAADQLAAKLEPLRDPKLDGCFCILNHNYCVLRRILGNLSTALSLRRGELAVLRRRVDLARLCSDLCSTASLFFAASGITLEFSTGHGELFANVDAVLVERVLLNLLSNSAGHTPPGGRIRLGLSSGSSNIVISVDDTGTGIPPEVMRNIFLRYEERISTAAAGNCSSGGLGLHVSRGIAEIHGGALIIESRENAGTSVRLLLPPEEDGRGSLTGREPEYTAPDIGLVLTELSSVLDSRFYGREYMD